MFNSGSIGFNCFLVELHVCFICVLFGFSLVSIWSLFWVYVEFICVLCGFDLGFIFGLMLGFVWVL